jgi:hypothetical protein
MLVGHFISNDESEVFLLIALVPVIAVEQVIKNTI